MWVAMVAKVASSLLAREQQMQSWIAQAGLEKFDFRAAGYETTPLPEGKSPGLPLHSVGVYKTGGAAASSLLVAQIYPNGKVGLHYDGNADLVSCFDSNHLEAVVEFRDQLAKLGTNYSQPAEVAELSRRLEQEGQKLLALAAKF
jgi:hypothetical protein